MPLVKQELLTLPEHLSSPLVFSGFCVVLSVVFCVYCRSYFCSFFLAIVLSVLWFTDSDYPLGIFKLKCYKFFTYNRQQTISDVKSTHGLWPRDLKYILHKTIKETCLLSLFHLVQLVQRRRLNREKITAKIDNEEYQVMTTDY
jgi:hypothetical protein